MGVKEREENRRYIFIHDVDNFPYIAYRMTRNAVKNLSGMMPERNSDEL